MKPSQVRLAGATPTDGLGRTGRTNEESLSPTRDNPSSSVTRTPAYGDVSLAYFEALPTDPNAALHVTTLLRALGGLCILAGCDRPHRALGLCNMHYLSRYTRAVEAELIAARAEKSA